MPLQNHSDFECPVMQVKSKIFLFDKYFVKKDTNRIDNYSLYAHLYAAQEAVKHSGLDEEALDIDRYCVPLVSVESKKLKIKCILMTKTKRG